MFRYDLVWNKGLTSGFLNANRQPLRKHEQIAVFYKKVLHIIRNLALANLYMEKG